MDRYHTWKDILEKLSKTNTNLFYLLLVCIISVSLLQTGYAQTQLDSESQTTLSDNLLNDPIAQDILKKIEQTKKMIKELEQKEYEKNQAQENLQKMRDVSIKRLNQNLDEWERLWEKHSSRNSFEAFVNKKPSYVHGVFWDQFEFKEQKVNAGRIAMNKVLINGGTMQDAKDAYNKAASTLRIELIEMNAQFNIKHNLADAIEQEIFNSVGQAHSSAAAQAKLANLYSDYKLQPSYILANSDNMNTLEINSETQCEEGLVLVSRVTSGNQSCVDESTAKKWINNGVKGIVILGDTSTVSEIKINPGTKCREGYQVIYHIAKSEYQCVLESDAKEMIEQNIAENHTLIDYIASKDKLKIYEDVIYEINQEIMRINEEYDLKNKILESKYNENLENADFLAKQRMQEAINEYKIGNITKEDINKQISEIRKTSDDIKEKILDKRIIELNKLESEQKDSILEAVKGYEDNPDINVDWDYYMNNTSDVMDIENEEKTPTPVKVSFSNEDTMKINLENVDIVNSFGQKFDEIKADQALQIAVDITNPNEYRQDFAYIVKITDDENNLMEPAKWVTGTLDPVQTFNVSLSWIPEDIGEYRAIISIGTDIDSVLQVADVEINVNPEGNISDDNYCKNGHELLFKYSDNSPICVVSDTASKLIKIGLAFA